MANSLIAVVSYCMHCKVCTHLNYGICNSSTDYLYCILAYDIHFCPDDDWSIQSKRRQSLLSELKLVTDNLLSISYCKTKHARPCYTVTSIINAQISHVPRLPVSFLLALQVIRRKLPLNLCIHSLFRH